MPSMRKRRSMRHDMTYLQILKARRDEERKEEQKRGKEIDKPVAVQEVLGGIHDDSGSGDNGAPEEGAHEEAPQQVEVPKKKRAPAKKKVSRKKV